MRGPEFRSAIDDLLADLAAAPTAVMCSESLWWRCHRRLVADFLTLVEGTPVCHLDHSGRLRAHRVAPGARRTRDDVLVYDATEN